MHRAERELPLVEALGRETRGRRLFHLYLDDPHVLSIRYEVTENGPVFRKATLQTKDVGKIPAGIKIILGRGLRVEERYGHTIIHGQGPDTVEGLEECYLALRDLAAGAFK